MIGLTLLIAVPVGVLAAIYMAEYAKKGKVLSTIRFCVESLAGIPRSSTACLAILSL